MADPVIPQLTAIRGRVPGTYDPMRRPGSSGQRYFSDIEYVTNVDSPAAQTAVNLAAQGRRNEQAAGLQALNLSNLARQQRPLAQTLTDAEVIEKLGGITDPSGGLTTERQQIGEAIGAMNQYNINPYRAAELMNVPFSDVQKMMGPYYTAQGEAKPAGVASLLEAQKGLVSEAGRRLPVGMTPAQRSVTGALQDAPNDMVAKLLNMGIFTPETAAQFYQSRYPGLTAEQVQGALGQYGYAQGGLASVVPKGMYLGGSTDGMADQIPATINNQQPAALSDGEFVIPADVVSHLGNGNSDAGAKQLYGMMDRIRKARTGNTEQGKQINPNKFLA